MNRRPLNLSHHLHPTLYRIDAAAAADERGVILAPASALIQTDAAGGFSLQLLTPAQADDATLGKSVTRVDRQDSVLIPGLVNAHTHLDLTSVGPYEPGRGDFPRFLNHVRGNRPVSDAEIAAAVRTGIDLSLAGGVVAVGDIAGCPTPGPSAVPFHVLAASDLAGISFVEYFGIGKTDTLRAEQAAAVVAGLTPTANVRPGLSPHAPYTVAPAAYHSTIAHAVSRGVPVCTHLAESPAEREFIAKGTGPHRQLLESFGLWHDGLAADFADGNTPIEHLAPVLGGSQTLVVHCNDVSDTDLQLLRGPVVYCPRSSAYFQAERSFGPHRYQDMIRAGITVAMGTDSIINLPAHAADPSRGGISVLEEARFLFQRDSTPATMLMGMMTTAGALALGLPTRAYRLGEPGETSHPRGVVAVRVGAADDHLNRVFGDGSHPELLFLRK